uniref:Uncharacterized protein n=1 Tax=Populus trichocarpa TaxID=3694 RepID=A0A3N7FIU0_POPTR
MILPTLDVVTKTTASMPMKLLIGHEDICRQSMNIN